jgi:hypothetical protein
MEHRVLFMEVCSRLEHVANDILPLMGGVIVFGSVHLHSGFTTGIRWFAAGCWPRAKGQKPTVTALPEASTWQTWSANSDRQTAMFAECIESGTWQPCVLYHLTETFDDMMAGGSVKNMGPTLLICRLFSTACNKLSRELPRAKKHAAI